ncbi:MAG: DUF4410 domain-containing protein [Acidobacteria bacterium]|nr:DUF4410 domain-containing protein [Acidobacteriota bacterium]
MRALRKISRAMICLATVLLCGVGTMAQDKPKSVKIKASAIQVDMIHSDEIKLPAEFQVSMYEDLIRQLQKKGGFARVYREGDRNAASAPDLVLLRSNVTGFKEGSQRKREVTTVTGETSIKIHCVFSDKDGKTVLEADVTGKVRFFGGNLRATYDFAKATTKIAHENFSAST